MSKAIAAGTHEPDSYVAINDACARFGFSRRSFYRMLDEHPELEQAGIVIRIPPVTGNRKVGIRAFLAWVHRRNGVRGEDTSE